MNLAQSQNSNGKISGTVTDKKSRLPIESADVTLLKQRDSSIVTGTNTDINGNFVLNNLSDGKYKIIIKIIGHNILKVSGLVINQQKNEIVLDTIKLTSGTEFETSTIEIESEKSKIQFSGDKKIFNVGDDISNVGGNALDVLKNVPSILVDVDGNISLRGSQNVKILVDGKPFGLEGTNRNAVLQQIPANTVESIELITNPSAKYDPEGTTGILNIVLKKNSDFGYNGNLNLNAGTQDKYSGGINLNIKNSKINIFGSYNITDNFNEITGTSQRQNLFKTESEFIN
ncbi:MAG: TonB-dependent receptor, partial [Ignavibacteria bacterium]|nr:TonB-dependent receptor [Ignavibacteria bacterium]